MTGTRRTAFKVALVALVGVLLVSSYGLSRDRRPHTEASARALDRVVLFAIPDLSLDALDADLMPNLDRLANRGAIAVANVRTESDEPDLLAAYSSLSAGNRTTGAAELALPEAVDSDVPWRGTTAIDAITARVGHPVTGDLAVPAIDEVAAEVAPQGGATVGALGTALRDAQERTAFVGQSGALELGGPGRAAPGALVAADEDGMIDAGTVSDDLFTTLVDPDGVELMVSDPDAFAKAVRDAQDDADLVVVDTGDTTRARVRAEAEALQRAAEEAAQEEASEGQPTTTIDPGTPTTTEPPDDEERAEDLRSSALRRADLTLGAVSRDLAPGTLLLVVGVTPSGTDWGFTPLVATGSGIARGYLDSTSTHRPALVTLTDIAPTILDTLEVEAPDGMIGRPLRFRAADSTWTEARVLDQLIADRESVDRTMNILFITAQAILYGLTALVLLRERRMADRTRRWAVLGALTCGAWPVSTFLLRIWTPLYGMGTLTIALSWAIALGIALVASRFRASRLDPLLVVSGLTVAVLVGDLATGAHLQVGSFFGYMPHTAPRFTGLGNSGFALLAGASIVLVVAIVDRARDRDIAWWVAAAVAAVVVLADGAPWMGTDVGGILALVPVLGVTLWALRGGRVRIRTLVIGGLLGALVLALAVGFEALRDPDDRTHIGRFFLRGDDGGAMSETLRRKWNTNIDDLRRNPWFWSVPILLVVGLFAGWRAEGLRRLLPARSRERLAVVATLAVGVIGWLVNDSGVVVLALVCVQLGPLVLLLVDADAREPIRSVEAVAGSPPPEEDPPTSAPPDDPPISADPVPRSPDTMTDPDPERSEDRAAEHVVAIVPAKDRADSVADTVAALLAIDRVDRVLVVDDGSSDATAERARAAGADVLCLGRNRGKGGAVLAGATAVPEATVFLLIDADLARTAAAADGLLDPVLAGDADLTIGVLPSAGSKGGFGTIRRLSAAGIRRASGLNTEAPLSGQRAIRADLLRGLVDAERFGLEVAMTIDVVRAGGRVQEIPVPMDHRHTGRSVSGFAHRGRQGVDIVRSLLPRLVGRPVRWAALAVLIAAWVIGSDLLADARRPASALPTEAVERVLLVGVPGLGLDDVDPAVMPELDRLATEGSFGLVTPRTAAARTPANGYATIGAGDRASVPESDPLVIDAAAPEGAEAAAVLERAFGDPPEGAVLVPAMPRLDQSSVNGRSRPSSLAGALHGADLRTGIVANSASGDELEVSTAAPERSEWSAPAALAVTDPTGSIDLGTVDAVLLQTAPDRPFGRAVDPDRVVADALEAAETAAVVVVDPGETSRWQQYSHLLPPGAQRADREEALALTDAVIGGLADGADDSTLLVVVGVTPAAGDPLAPLVVAGPGRDGARLYSTTTRQADVVGLADLAPTVLEALDVAVPEEMAGAPLQRVDGPVDRDSLEQTQALIQARDHGYRLVVDQLVWASLALFTLLGALHVRTRLTGRPTPRTARSVLRWAVLTLAAVPTGSYVARAVEPLYDTSASGPLLTWLTAAVVAWLALRADRHPLDPLLVVAITLWAIVSIDLFFGGALQVSSYLGHTPSVAARFVGLGNAAFGAYGAAAVVICAGVVARAPRRSGAWATALGVAVITVVTTGLPWLGSDVGGILTLVPALGLVLWMLRGGRVTLMSGLIAVVGGAAALGAIVAVEALRPAADRTHIGRFFLGSDSSGAWDTIHRKWSVNVDLLGGSTWSWLIWAGLAYLAVTLVAHAGRGGIASAGSPSWIAFLGLVGVGFLGWSTNDSGPLVAAITLVVIAALISLLAFDDHRSGDRWLPAGPDRPRADLEGGA